MIDYNRKLSNVRETQVPSQRMSILELLYENIKCQFHAVLWTVPYHNRSWQQSKLNSHWHKNPFCTNEFFLLDWNNKPGKVHCIHQWVKGYYFEIKLHFFLWRLFLSEQTIQTLMKCRILRHFIWVFTVVTMSQYIFRTMCKRLRCALAIITVYIFNLAFSCSKVANLENQLTNYNRARCESFRL